MTTDHELTCDKCGAVHHSFELFWNIDWEEHTERELVAIDCMDEQGLEAVCRSCFDKLIEGALA